MANKKKKKSGVNKVIRSLKSFGNKKRSRKLQSLFVMPTKVRPY